MSAICASPSFQGVSKIACKQHECQDNSRITAGFLQKYASQKSYARLRFDERTCERAARWELDAKSRFRLRLCTRARAGRMAEHAPSPYWDSTCPVAAAFIRQFAAR